MLDYQSIETTLSEFAGGFVSPGFFSFEVYEDGVAEEVEGFVLFLEVLESELDERDVGQVDLARAAYLVRINQSGTIAGN